MDYRETELIMARMADLQPRVPDWSKAEHSEIIAPQKELWCCGTNNHGIMMRRIIQWILGRQKREEANP